MSNRQLSLFFSGGHPQKHTSPQVFKPQPQIFSTYNFLKQLFQLKQKPTTFSTKFTHQTHVTVTPPPTHGIQTYAPGNPKDDGRQEGTSYRIKGTMYKNTTSPKQDGDVFRCGDALGTCCSIRSFLRLYL